MVWDGMGIGRRWGCRVEGMEKGLGFQKRMVWDPCKAPAQLACDLEPPDMVSWPNAVPRAVGNLVLPGLGFGGQCQGSAAAGGLCLWGGEGLAVPSLVDLSHSGMCLQPAEWVTASMA